MVKKLHRNVVSVQCIVFEGNSRILARKLKRKRRNLEALPIKIIKLESVKKSSTGYRTCPKPQYLETIMWELHFDIHCTLRMFYTGSNILFFLFWFVYFGWVCNNRMHSKKSQFLPNARQRLLAISAKFPSCHLTWNVACQTCSCCWVLGNVIFYWVDYRELGCWDFGKKLLSTVNDS